MLIYCTNQITIASITLFVMCFALCVAYFKIANWELILEIELLLLTYVITGFDLLE